MLFLDLTSSGDNMQVYVGKVLLDRKEADETVNCCSVHHNRARPTSSGAISSRPFFVDAFNHLKKGPKELVQKSGPPIVCRS